MARGGVLANGDWSCGGGLWEWRPNREAKLHLVRLADIDGAKTVGAESDSGSGGFVGDHCAQTPSGCCWGFMWSAIASAGGAHRNGVPRCNPETRDSNHWGQGLVY